jgi:hypothetical protein
LVSSLSFKTEQCYMNASNPIKFVTNFGTGKAGLSSVGFSLNGSDRVTDGVTELVLGTGIYGITIDGITAPGYILWDTGGSSKLYTIEDINIPLCNVTFQSVNLGQSRTGLSNVGATVAGTRTIAPELLPGTGIYGELLTPPRGFRGSIFWDSGEGSGSIHAVGSINLEYELVYFFQTSSTIFKKVIDAVGKIELQEAIGSVGEIEPGHLLISDGGYLLLSDGSKVSLRQPS